MSVFLDLAIKVGTYAATMLGVIADSVSLSGASGWASLPDNPLYSTGSASPKLDITANKDFFRLKLVQPNEIGEDYDDNPVTLTGTAYQELSPGIRQELWKYDLTYTYDDITLGMSSKNQMFVSGILKHVVAPENPGHENDEKDGAAMLVSATLTAPEVCGIFSCEPPNPSIRITNSGLLSQAVHPKNHFDYLETNKLGAQVMTPNLFNWYSWDHELVGRHSPVPIPGPLPILGLGAAFGFSRKLRKCIKLHKGTSDISNSAGA